ncbi:MarR family winged helix-turn-helix transcriptional regulator [Dokdonia sp. Hel_I_53]|uniref:MarR family winged helix-turn-helix transcriptional regulator n=1 Tax=Dokdonia sp. Hel_I_53 TaxID=1566287 RepID=UPI00119B793C|nr:MarR family transcriptional regulator [Dokdonia sp. Hel_I_53]TVZ51117.1 DNA-binding MarR family transcriptional regulator [Dokdonia sp. Hel_I_53]
MDNKNKLHLDNQVCFPLYSVSRLLTQAYKPYLDKWGITYPQYLVLMVLWETDMVSVKHISKTLMLNTNTISPLLRRMENLDLIKRTRSKNDERSILISLSQKGRTIKKRAAHIPENLLKTLCSDTIELEDINRLKKTVEALIYTLSTNDNKD